VVDEVMGGGAAAHSAGVPLFSRAAPKGFVVAGGGAAAAAAPAPAAQHAPAMDPAAQVGAPHESIQVATGVDGVLQSARPYVLPNGGGYRGPAVRGGVVNAASHDAMGGQPVPPALASQVEAMVYGGGVQVGNPHDPVMIWSSAARAAAQPAPAVASQQPVGVPVQPVAQAAVPTVPMEPPAGAYGGAPAPAPAMAVAAPAADPFLARAEAAGGSVSFG
jgi:hypothetical protein